MFHEPTKLNKQAKIYLEGIIHVKISSKLTKKSEIFLFYHSTPSENCDDVEES